MAWGGPTGQVATQQDSGTQAAALDKACTGGNDGMFGGREPEFRFQTNLEGEDDRWFGDPRTPLNNRYYYPKVNAQTGKTEVWEANLLGDPTGGLSDRMIGTYEKVDGEKTFTPSSLFDLNLYAAIPDAEETEWFTSTQGLNQLDRVAQDTYKLGQQGGNEGDCNLTPENAEKRTDELFNDGEVTTPPEEADPSTDVDLRGEGAEGTRNEFPGAKGLNPLIYPENMANTSQDVIKFSMLKYAPKEFADPGAGDKGGTIAGASESSGGAFGTKDRRGFSDEISIGSVVMAIPGGIGDKNSVSWGDSSMNAVQMALAATALQGVSGNLGGALGGLSKQIQEGRADQLDDALKSYFAAAAVGTDAGDLLTRSTGLILNPNMELLFKSPALRPFTFRFRLSPRSKTEAKTIIKIIRFFKQGMAPIKSQSHLFLKSPHTFKIQYKHRGHGETGEVHPYLNQFKECALQSFDVNYTPEQTYSTFSDGVMTSYELNMSFKELEPVYNDDYTLLDGNEDTMIGY